MPIWLLDRYQIEAAAKSLGGVDFPYALNGEGLSARTVPGATQWAALYALLDTLSPAELTVPPRLQPLLSAGFGGNSDRQTDIEIIPTAGGPVFDPLKATEVGAVQTLDCAARARAAQSARSAACGRRVAFRRPRSCSTSCSAATLAASGSDVGRRIATTTILALARVQRDAALSPTIALELAGAARPPCRAAAARSAAGRAAGLGRGLAALLKDREALDKAVADPARLPRVPPGMPIGMDEAL